MAIGQPTSGLADDHRLLEVYVRRRWPIVYGRTVPGLKDQKSPCITWLTVRICPVNMWV